MFYSTHVMFEVLSTKFLICVCVWLLAGNFFFAPTGDFHQKIELTAKQNKKKKKTYISKKNPNLTLNPK